MALSIQRDFNGPDWPAGLITVAASGTPVNIMSVLDPTNLWAPGASAVTSPEYAPRVFEISFTAVKSVAPVVLNTGAIYIVRAGAAGGSGNKTDSGSIVAILQPGVATALQTFVLRAAPFNRDIYNPYRYFIDADTNADGCLVTFSVQ